MRDDIKRSPAEVEGLLDALAAGDISDEQVEAICALLAQDTPAARELALRIRSTLMIRGWFQAEHDSRFTKETAELVARLRQDSGRAFVIDTMQRVRDAAQSGEHAVNCPSVTKPSRRAGAHFRVGRKRAQAFPYVLVAIASAACVFLAFQLGLLPLPGTRERSIPPAAVEPQTPGLEVAAATNARLGNSDLLKAGDRLRAGDTINVGASGSAQLRYADQTSVALHAGSQLVILPGEAIAGAKERSKHLLLHSGELEAKVTPQRAGQPVLILTPHARATVVGTQFTLRIRDSQTHLQVTEGSVEFQRGNQRLVIEKDMLALADESGLRKIIPTAEPAFEELVQNPRAADTDGDGQWSVRQTDEGPVLCQTNAACVSATLRLAAPKWKSGYLTGQYRVIRAADDTRHLAAWQVLTTSRTDTRAVSSNAVPYMGGHSRFQGQWTNINVRFAVSGDGRLRMQCMPNWLEDMPPSLRRIGATGDEAADAGYPEVAPIADVDLFGLAIECRMAAAEFRRLRFYPHPSLPELDLETSVSTKIAAQKGGGIDLKRVAASDTGSWRLTETDDGLQILQDDGAPLPSTLSVGIIPHSRILISGEVMALSTNRTDGIPAPLQDDRASVTRSEGRLAFNELHLSRHGHRVDSPCFLATPSDHALGRTTLVSHFCTGEEYGLVEKEKWYRFVVFIDSDYFGKMVEGHAYRPEGQPAKAAWCMPLPFRWLTSDHKPFTLRLYTNGQRLLWRNLKIVPY